MSCNITTNSVYKAFEPQNISPANVQANPNIKTTLPQTVGDTVTISTKPKSNKTKTLLKLAIGAGVIVGGVILARKIVCPQLVKGRCEKLFMREFTVDEAKAIQQKYKDIYKIKDKNEFIDKLVAELRKDYQIDDIPLRVDRNFVAGSNKKGCFNVMDAGAVFSPCEKKGYFKISIDSKKYDIPHLLEDITHELRHAKQHKMMFQCCTPNEYADVYIKKAISAFEKSNKPKEIKFVRMLKTNPADVRRRIIEPEYKFYEKCGIKKMSPNDKNYEWARKCLESAKVCCNTSTELYHKAFTEIDAHNAQHTMANLVK